VRSAGLIWVYMITIGVWLITSVANFTSDSSKSEINLRISRKQKEKGEFLERKIERIE